MSVGGPIGELSLAGRELSVAEDAESNRKIGGDENEIQMNGDGTFRIIKTKTGWQSDGLVVDCDDDNEVHEFLQNLANRKDAFPIVVGYASGAIWQGDGTIIGEIAYSSKNTTIPLTLGGGVGMTSQ